MTFNVTLDSAEVQRVIDGLPSLIFRAQRSAIGDTTAWAKKELQNALAIKTGIPDYVFRRFRVKTRRDQERGIVWLGLNEVKAAYVGKLSQDATGAFAGQYYFPGGFIATMNSGHTGIFKRKGTSRLPLVEQAVNLDTGFEVAAEIASLAGPELRRRFVDKVRELNPHLQ